MSAFEAFRCRFGEVPVGFILRKTKPANWTRFHALPNAKRYASTPLERTTILQRANALGSALFRGGQSCVVTVCRDTHMNRREKKTWKRLLAFDQRGFIPCGRWRVDHHEEPEWSLGSPWSFYACRAHWEPGGFDDMFASVADDRLWGVGWIGASTECALLPYDGGFDVIASDRSVLRGLEADFASWRPDTAERL